MPNVGTRLKFVSSGYLLGTLVAVLSIMAAVSGYQSAIADSNQTRYNVQGQQKLTDGNAEYLSANQLIYYDYTLYDSWYTATNDEDAQYFQKNFSSHLKDAMSTSTDDLFNDSYYNAMYADANGLFDEADQFFGLADQSAERANALRLILLVSALGLALAAWASLLKEGSSVRLVFAVFSVAILVYSVVLYLTVPTVAA